ncbi:MAG: hypothetical protein ACO3JL_15785, partial [Myxococcota bacterium]
MTIRLLLADADPAAHARWSEALAPRGFTITLVAEPQEALLQFKPARFDVVLFVDAGESTVSLAFARQLRGSAGGRGVAIAIVGTQPLVHDDDLRAVDEWFSGPGDLVALSARLAELAEHYTGAMTPAMHVGTPHQSESEPRPTVASPAVARLPGPTPSPLVDVHSAARTLLTLARAEATGVLTLSLRDAEVKVAFLRGVMVGAMDNSMEHRLLSRLVRRGVLREGDLGAVLAYSQENQLRAAEAVLALEHCDAETLLDELEQQARARLILAAGWRAGEMRFAEGQSEVDRLAISSFDMYEILLRRFHERPDHVMIDAWIERAAKNTLTAGNDLVDGLAAYARLVPQSPLRAPLGERPLRGSALLAAIDVAPTTERAPLRGHLYGMWVAGLLRLPTDPPGDPRGVPRPVRSEELGDTVPDKEACSLVRSEWLRAQGRDLYAVLQLPRTAKEAELRTALQAYQQRFGKETLGQKNIDPVSGLARELWALMEQLEDKLLDSHQRRTYDEMLASAEDFTSMELS